MAVWGDCSWEVTRGNNNSKQSGERTGSIGERDLVTGNTQNSDTVLMYSSICLRWVTDSKDSWDFRSLNLDRVCSMVGKGTGDISGLRSC